MKYIQRVGDHNNGGFMQWLSEHYALIVTVLFGFSEALGMLPGVKSSSVFEIVYAALKAAKDSLAAPTKK